MQENGRGEQAGRHVAKVNDFIETVQLAGVVEAEEDERNQAQDIEMARFMGAAPAEVDE